ncbi:acetyltransferase (GNAT) family protein [Roseibium hamelinense]|uniref:Acetyltransferase (GNAT) family protein n=1 Tax=Roseibium hamelinense TaxID=150831 RepID=A0A562SXN7_9HYPH|nr:GNAT family N-acetyltransferase [Roseibium hamelinense]MTI43609.1 GNAT family N-acetyltransferase [Roseibium hamelinense]TWI86125.1 acetyltransferase (GNAT) family protein [Roseibium hamelinense]
MSVTIRPLEDDDHEAVRQLLTARWAGPEILLDGEMVDASRLPGFAAIADQGLVGLVTLIKRQSEWEILTLDSLYRWGGTGTLLLDAVVDDARASGIKRLTVRTSNDNLDAFRFYQRRGFRFERVAQGVIDKEREQKPEIPLRGDYGIEIRDEILFARSL